MLVACPRCGQSQDLHWTAVSDAQTGTVYLRCEDCGTHVVSSPHGYIDWGVGLLMESRVVMGSVWTQRVAPTFVADVSRLTQRASK